MKKINNMVLFIFFLFFIFITYNKNTLTSEQLMVVAIFLTLLVIGNRLYDTYRVVRNKEYTSIFLIIISNIIAVLSIVLMFYFYYITTKETGLEILIVTNKRITHMIMLYLFTKVLNEILMSKRFKIYKN